MLRKYGINAIDFIHEGKDKESRLRYCKTYMESKRVIFVEGDYLQRGSDGSAGFIDVIKSFPKVDHDEEVDVLCMAILLCLDQGSFSRQHNLD